MNRALLLEAVAELKRRKLRTGLTLLGMIFGVGAIVAMLAVGEGSRREALRLVAELGLNNVIVESKGIETEQLKDIRTRSLGLSAADAAAALSVVPGAQSVALKKEIKVDQLVVGDQVVSGRAFAVSPGYADHGGLQLKLGRWLLPSDGATLAPVCVLGARLAHTLFGAAPAVGQRVKVNHVWLQVVGVLADRTPSKSEFEGVKLGLDDERLFVPWETARARFSFRRIEDEVDGISVRLDDKVAPDDAARVLQAVIHQRHGGVDDTNLIVPMGLYRQNQQTQRIFTIVMSSIAAVSLLVGGIGIMNIMLANVLERRREIGLLRAIGARRQDIVARFLREAVVICASGALIGLLFGALLAYAIAAFAGWQVAWEPFGILASVLACLLIGIAFSIYPARQAAELDPIAAIRDE